MEKERGTLMASELLGLAGLLGRMDSNLRLHAFVYLAQEFGCWEDAKYEFDFTLNVPFSPELEDEFLQLQKGGSVRYEDGEYVVDTPATLPSTLKHPEVLREIAGWDTWQLVDLARLVFLETDPVSEPSLEERAKRLFLMGKEKVAVLKEQMKGLDVALVTA